MFFLMASEVLRAKNALLPVLGMGAAAAGGAGVVLLLVIIVSHHSKKKKETEDSV